jgi:hypothetical protein
MSVATGLVLVALAVSGCAGSPESPVPEAKLTLKLESTVEANDYGVRLSWSCDEADRFLVFRRNIDDGVTATTEVGGEKREWLDTPAVPGSKYEYTVTRKHSNRRTVVGTGTIDIPKDVVVDGEMDATKLPRVINRLFLQKNSTLRTGRSGLVIDVKELHADDATIETFPENDLARQPELGSDAGPVRISAVVAKGRLRIVNRGQPGAPGRDGAKGATGKTGAAGSAGDLEPNPKFYIDPWGRPLPPSIKQVALNRLKNYGSDDEIRRVVGGIPAFICSPPPGNGSRGGQGGIGENGGNGTHGGASARFVLQVGNSDGLEIDPVNEGGRGGRAGRGGVGGDGGAGGAAGPLDVGKLCSAAKPGEVGPTGAPGKDGLAGKDGFRTPMCIRIGDRESEGCAAYSNLEVRR